MDATSLIIKNCYNAFLQVYDPHFSARNGHLSRTCAIYPAKKTRSYQHFLVVLSVFFNARSPYGEDTFTITLRGKYNTRGELRFYMELGHEDPFEGAADFESLEGRVRYFFDDIVRSFSENRSRFNRAIIHV